MKTKSILFLAACLLAGCTPHVVIDQSKPLEVDVNIKGNVDVTLHADDDMQTITGEKPTNVVRPEDIGLPPKSTSGSTTAPATAPAAPGIPVPLLDVTGDPTSQPATPEDRLKTSLHARNKDIRALWDAGKVGEAHDGLVKARTTLSTEEQAILDAENTDRKELFSLRAKERNVSVDDVIQSYYLARLGYAKNGAWYERYVDGSWQWKQWGTKP